MASTPKSTGPDDAATAAATNPRPVALSPALRDHVRAYAARLGLPAPVLAELAQGAGASATEVSFWHVETEVWWERRFFRYKGARETGTAASAYQFGSLALAARALPDRWSLAHDRPEAFHAAEHRSPLAVEGVEELELEVLFGVQTHVASLGDAGFPAAFLHALPVHAKFQGVDSVPVVAARGGAPYREASVPADRPDIPSAVMRMVREFVRHIDLPGYTDRIHGWRTTVRGGPFVRARFALGTGRAAGRTVEALVIGPSGLVYAPELSDA